MKRLISLLPLLALYLAGCADQSERLEEPVQAEMEESSDEEAEEDASGDPSSEPAPQPDMQDDAAEGDSFDGEAAEDMDAGADVPAAAAPAEPTPNEKGGIISSGVKPKPAQRCNLIEDEIERRRCLMKQSKKKRGS